MIKKIQTYNQTSISEAIKSNGVNAITGDLLQEQMLLLNRDLFGGEIEYRDSSGSPLFVGEINSSLRLLRPSGNFKTMLQEWYANGELPYGENVYLPVYRASSVPGAYIVICYLLLRQGEKYMGDDTIDVIILADTYGVGRGAGGVAKRFSIDVQSSDLDDSPIIESSIERAEYQILDMFLPRQDKTYTNLGSMLGDLDLSDIDYQNLLAGKYTYVRDMNGGARYLYPIMFIDLHDKGSVTLGYNKGENNAYEIWELRFYDYEIRFSEL